MRMIGLTDNREISLSIVTGILVLIIILALVAYIKRSSKDCQSVTHLQQTVSTNNKNREDSSRNMSQGAREKELKNHLKGIASILANIESRLSVLDRQTGGV